ncbi:unnamed protein product [Spirodela intermedia]|uniref:Uncharacterized protein n=1 Tax=Spirodela intermedia TaxID=51605 RepID=A0A7I8JY48_SPIIN|nr:unnamed protein product [Spirodela intermedia]
MADVPSVTRGWGRYPAASVISSYHHHSRQTPRQLGSARRTRGPHDIPGPAAEEEQEGEGGRVL